jgi:hypothetical protein
LMRALLPLVLWAVAGVVIWLSTFEASVIAPGSRIGCIGSSSLILISPVAFRSCSASLPWPRPGSSYVHENWSVVICRWGFDELYCGFDLCGLLYAGCLWLLSAKNGQKYCSFNYSGFVCCLSCSRSQIGCQGFSVLRRYGLLVL